MTRSDAARCFAAGGLAFVAIWHHVAMWIVDERTGKRRKTRHRMTREYATSWHSGAEPDLLSVEVRLLSESPAEHEFNSAWLRKR